MRQNDEYIFTRLVGVTSGTYKSEGNARGKKMSKWELKVVKYLVIR